MDRMKSATLMIDDSESILMLELKERFYYLKLSDNDAYCWKQGNDNFMLMDDMGMDHLRACIKTVERDLTSLIKARGEKSNAVLTLKPIAEKKLKELNEIYKTKVNY